MASIWGAAWGSAWGSAWNAVDAAAPAPPAPNATPGWSAYVRDAKKKQGRNRPIPQDEELVHPESPEPIYASDAVSAEILSAERFAEMLTRPAIQAIKRQENDEKQRAEHRRRVAEALVLLIA